MQWLRVFLALCLLSAANLPAQTAASAAAPSMGPNRDITLDVVVTDKAGKPVHGLLAHDFTLLDNKQAKALTSFREVASGNAGPPVEMVIVIDAINAGVLKAELQRDGIRDFLLSNAGKLPVPVSIVTITDQNVSQPSTPSPDGNVVAAALEQSITGLRTVNRDTMFQGWDRFQLSLGALNKLVQIERPKPGKKLIVWVSPGWPLLPGLQGNLSAANQQALFGDIVRTSTALRLGHITLYNVVSIGVSANISDFWYYTSFLKGVKLSSQAYPPNLALPVLAVQTGGLVLNKSNDISSALAAEIATAAADAQDFYVITFPAAQADRANEYHTLEVKTDQPGLTARTRTGYYAQP
jgi:VWFA-related protein